MASGMTKLQKAGAILGIIMTLATMTGGTIGFMYTAIDTAVASEAKSREEGDLRTRIKVINNRLEFLRNKVDKDTDDDAEIESLVEERRIYRERLQELEQ